MRYLLPVLLMCACTPAPRIEHAGFIYTCSYQEGRDILGEAVQQITATNVEQEVIATKRREWKLAYEETMLGVDARAIINKCAQELRREQPF
ncbi:MAG: hypothetical protein OXR66_00575 [Candidatus Woesearchaeota archaeon]|nr:hypothetical protein [Candidatus Woesearchaeota archaeon]